MELNTVMVRAYGGEPLKRLLFEINGQTAIVCNPEFVEDVRTGKASPIGFPIADVFRFDPELFAQLRQASGKRLDRLWKLALPYQATSN